MDRINKLIIAYSTNAFLKVLGTIVITLIISILSLADFSSSKNIELKLPFLDKLVHFFMYLGYAVILLVNGMNKGIFYKYKVLIYCTLFGLLMEILQNYVFTYRSGDAIDLIFNILGSLTGFLVFTKWMKTTIQ